MRNTTTTVVIAAGAVLAAVIVTRTPAQQEYGPVGPPPPGPTVVSMTVSKDTLGAINAIGEYRIFRAWSDGHVDMTYASFQTGAPEQCDPPTQCGPTVVLQGTCPTDIDRDGDTGIIDFLTLLAGWGACR